MSFKDDVAADLDVFFNEDEFAETADFNGVAVKIVRDTLELDPFNSPERKGVYQGAAKRMQKVFIKTADVPQGVFIKATVKIDKESWKVEDFNEIGGVTELILANVGAR